MAGGLTALVIVVCRRVQGGAVTDMRRAATSTILSAILAIPSHDFCHSERSEESRPSATDSPGR